MRAFFFTIAFLLVYSGFCQTDETMENPFTYEVNKLYPRVNVIPYSSEEDLLKQDYKNSPYVLSLNGMWKFKWAKGNFAEKPESIFHPKYVIDNTWEDISAPSNWELNGIGTLSNGKLPFLSTPPSIAEEENITGAYYQEFEIPKDWKETSIYLYFGGVKSAFKVWINGKYVGYSQDSKTPSEFEISKFVEPGLLNKMLVMVYAYSAGSYLETQYALNLSGIEQDVFIYSKTLINIYDYKVETTLDKKFKDGNLRLQIKLENNMGSSFLSGKKEYYLEAEIWDEKGMMNKYYKYFTVGGKEKFIDVEFNEVIESPRKWTAETPNLYTLILRLKDKKQNELELTGCKIGFRTFEVKNGLLLVNGTAIKIKGVNRPEYEDSMGCVVSEKVMLQDIKLMKENNINAVRTINHPSHPRFYELCDLYGLYVINEANAALYKGANRDDLARNIEWEEPTVARVRNMYERDKNHPCIIMWSLGNGSSNGICYENAYKWLKERDNITPILYKSAQLYWNSDVHSPTCPTLKNLSEYGSKTQKLPLIMAEYMPIMGNCLGGLKEYWDTIYKYPQLQGGCIGSWIDQGKIQRDASNHKYWTLGDNMSITKAYNMGGLLLPNRIPHPQLAEVKRAYQNMKVVPVNISEGEFEVFNFYDFTNLKELELNYRIFSNLKQSVSEGEITVDVRPRQSAKFSIKIPKMNTYPNEDYYIIFTLRQKQTGNIIEKGTELGFEQFELKMNKPSKSVVSETDMKEVFVKEDSAQALIYTEDIELIFDKKNVKLTRFAFHDAEVLKSSPTLNFFRAPTDNDYEDNNGQNIWKVSGFNHLKTRINDVKIRRINKNIVRILLAFSLDNIMNEPLFNIFQTYTIYGSGDIFIENRINPTKLVQALPKIGMQMQLPSSFVNAYWYGLDNETYSDRKASGKIGAHNVPTENLYNVYLRPQESGNHVDTRWVSFAANNNLGLFFDADVNFNFSVRPYDDENLAGAKSAVELQKKPYYVLNIDYAQAGIGSATCDNDLPDKYVIRNQNVSFTLHMKPFHLDEAKPEYFRMTKFEHPVNDILSTPKIVSDRKNFDSTMFISLVSDQPDVQIHYTLDGTEPTEHSTLYAKPFEIQKTTIICARAFKKDFAPSFTAKASFNFNYAKSVTYEYSPNTPYNKSIESIPFDNIRGKATNLENNWVGFSGNDFIATVELVKPLNIKSVEVGFAHIPDAWAFLPINMAVSFSEDGTNFSTPVKVSSPFNSADEKTDMPNAVDIKVDAEGKNIRFVKIEAKNLGKIPDWHSAKGLKPWIMIDEISIIEKLPEPESKPESKIEEKK